MHKRYTKVVLDDIYNYDESDEEEEDMEEDDDDSGQGENWKHFFCLNLITVYHSIYLVESKDQHVEIDIGIWDWDDVFIEM